MSTLASSLNGPGGLCVRGWVGSRAAEWSVDDTGLDPCPHTLPFLVPKHKSTASSLHCEDGTSVSVCACVCVDGGSASHPSSPRLEAFNLVRSPSWPVPGLADPISEVPGGSEIITVPKALCCDE